MEQMQNEMKRLQNQHRAEERRARTHRICKRGGLIESLLPDTIGLSDERFSDFIKRSTANDHGRKALAEFVAAQEKEDAADGADGTGGGDAPPAPVAVATAQGENTTAPKSAAPPLNTEKTAEPAAAQPTHGNGASSATKTAEANRQGA